VRTRIWRHPKAEEDLLEIWLYVARDSVSAADRLIESIADKVELLPEHPEMGPRRPDLGKGVRMVPVGSYLVLYKLGDRRVEIVRIVHGARDLRDLL
jgi:toxin ParE1/3/4